MRPDFRITLEPKNWEFFASGTLTLLAAAEKAGFNLPSSCRNGTCRTCMCRMLEGRVRYTIEWPGLSREEKHEGYILPCVAVPESDLTLEAGAATRA